MKSKKQENRGIEEKRFYGMTTWGEGGTPNIVIINVTEWSPLG